jgi:hypothetical protein
MTFTSAFLEKPGFWMMKNPVSWPTVQGYAHTPLSTMSWVKRQTIYMACNADLTDRSAEGRRGRTQVTDRRAELISGEKRLDKNEFM